MTQNRVPTPETRALRTAVTLTMNNAAPSISASHTRYLALATLAVLCFALTLAGCAADDVEATTTDALPVTGGSLTLASTLLDGAVEQHFVDANDASKTLTISRGAPGSKPGDTWIVRRAANGKSISEMTFIREDDGAVALLKTLEFSDGVATVFTPPLLVLPVRIQPGEAGRIERQLSMKVTELDSSGRDTGKAKTSGEGSVTLTYRGEVPVPESKQSGGGQAGRLLVSRLLLEPKPASVVTTTETWYGMSADGKRPTGVIAERQRTRVKVLGVKIKSSDSVWIAAPSPH